MTGTVRKTFAFPHRVLNGWVTLSYFYELGPLRDLFSQGTPVLMYHKIGKRPSGARMKGLYVSSQLFGEHLSQLRAASFRSASVSDLKTPAAPGSPRVVVTFDDGFTNVHENALPLLSQHQFQGMLYLVSNLIGKMNQWDLREGEVPEKLMEVSQIKEWMAQGNEIGSHSFSHARLTRLSLRDAREEIVTSKKQLEDTFQKPMHHFCYPYGDFNSSVRDLVIEAGYSTATTTQFGVNTGVESPWELKRIMARYKSRSLKNLKLVLNGFRLNS